MDCSYSCNVCQICLIFLRFGGIMLLFLTFIIFNIHSFNTFFYPSSFAEALLLASSSLFRSAREASMGCQVDALPTELRRTLNELYADPIFNLETCQWRWQKNPDSFLQQHIHWHKNSMFTICCKTDHNVGD